MVGGPITWAPIVRDGELGLDGQDEMSDDSRYEAMIRYGATPAGVDEAARRDGLDLIARIRLLKQAFGLSFTEAKAITIGSVTPKTLEERARELLEGFDALCRKLDTD